MKIYSNNSNISRLLCFHNLIYSWKFLTSSYWAYFPRKRKWKVENITTGKGYEIIPGSHDGIATSSSDWPFPRGDIWILRYRGTKIDDGSVATGPPYEAELDGFISGEPINGKDVVIWYGAHFTHDIASEPPGSHGHIVGPKLKPTGTNVVISLRFTSFHN